MINDLFHTYKKIIMILLLSLCAVVFWFYGCRGQKQGKEDVVKWECTKKKGYGRGYYRFETLNFSGTVVFGTAGYVISEKSMPVTLRITCEKEFAGVMKVTLPGENGKGVAWQAAVKCGEEETQEITLLVPQLGNPSAFSFEILDSFGSSELSETVTMAELKGEESSENAQQENEEETEEEEILLGVLSDEYKELSWLDGTQGKLSADEEIASGETGSAKVTLVRLTAKNFPADTLQLAALSGILIDSFDVSQFSAEQISCMKNWVSEGGKLVIGKESQNAALRKALSLPKKMDWVEADGMVVNTSIESYEENLEREAGSSDSGEESLSAEILAMGKFTVASYGEGEISLPGFSLLSEDFSEKEDREAAATVLLGSIVKEEDSEEDSETSLWYIKKALYAFRKSQLPNTFYYGIFFICYLFVVVLVAYYFLRRIKKREYIWVVVPALSVVFTLILFVRSMGIAGNDAGSFSALRILDTDEGEENIYLLCQNEETEGKNVNLIPGITSVVPLDYEYQTGGAESDSVNSSGEDITVNNTSRGFDISLGESVPGTSRLLKLSGSAETEDSETASDETVQTVETADSGAVQTTRTAETVSSEIFTADFSASYTAFSGTITNCSENRFSRLILIRGNQYVIVKDVKAGETVSIGENEVRYRNGYDKATSAFGDEEETSVTGCLMEYVEERYMQDSSGGEEILAVGVTDDSDFQVFSDGNKLSNHVTVMVSHFEAASDELRTIENLNHSCLEVEEDTESVGQDILEKQKTEVKYLLPDVEAIWALVRNRDSFDGKIYAYNYLTGEKDLLLNEWDDCIYPASLRPYLSESGEMVLTYEREENTGYESSAPVLMLVYHKD